MNPNPPINQVDFYVPFNNPKFNDVDFESLCADLFEKEFGIKFHKYGKKGNEQYGIDLISEKGNDGFHIAVQCKHVRRFSSSNVDVELKKFRNNPLQIKKLYFCTTCTLSTATVNHCYKQVEKFNDPLCSIETWDRDYISRQIKKHPDIVSSYFGTQWLDHLFPNLDEHYLKQLVDDLTNELNGLKVKNNIFVRELNENKQMYSGAKIELKPVVEGYFKWEDYNFQYHGDFPSNRGFCMKYSVSFDVGDTYNTRTMFSVILSPEDAVDLEAVLLMDLNKQASLSTYFSHDVFLTHIQGSTPIISIPTKNLAFLFARNSDYSLLLKCVEDYLNNCNDITLVARRYRTFKNMVNITSN